MDINDIARIAKIIRSLPLRDAVISTSDLGVEEAVGELRYIIAKHFVKELSIGALVRDLFMDTCNPAHPTVDEPDYAPRVRRIAKEVE